MSKYDIRADIVKNRLLIKLDGNLTDGEIKECIDKIVERAMILKKGFDVINDMSTFKPTSQAALNEMKRAQVIVKENGARRVIRVVDKTTLSLMQLPRTSSQAAYTAETAASVADAEKMLENK